MDQLWSKVLKNGDCELTEEVLRFKNHYSPITSFCSPGKGNERGDVEGKAGYRRRNMLVPVP